MQKCFYHKRELEQAVEKLVLSCESFVLIHGDCTFSNMMLRANGEPVLIDPRGYFGYTELFGMCVMTGRKCIIPSWETMTGLIWGFYT